MFLKMWTVAERQNGKNFQKIEINRILKFEEFQRA